MSPRFRGRRQFIAERSRLRLNLVKLHMGLRELGRQTRVAPADSGQLVLFGSERLIQLPQLRLQMLSLLFVLALLPVALFLCCLPEMVQGFTGVAVFVFQRCSVALGTTVANDMRCDSRAGWRSHVQRGHSCPEHDNHLKSK
ncbi:hypothetical protein [Aromatoleum evansii]|uniref:hypothetical protein n=1 Tax=Aromatoleum evansii TaxID=59406 RepID=UPI00145F4C4C|nr:hypothetical protein [Aromatoleum evansii]NMG28062.1 hypothetical protein [Aromatoleum evansii]